nr:uncharacterized protein LOC101041860 [Saimiri boliviensis boliviensis]
MLQGKPKARQPQRRRQDLARVKRRSQELPVRATSQPDAPPSLHASLPNRLLLTPHPAAAEAAFQELSRNRPHVTAGPATALKRRGRNTGASGKTGCERSGSGWAVCTPGSAGLWPHTPGCSGASWKSPRPQPTPFRRPEPVPYPGQLSAGVQGSIAVRPATGDGSSQQSGGVPLTRPSWPLTWGVGAGVTVCPRKPDSLSLRHSDGTENPCLARCSRPGAGGSPLDPVLEGSEQESGASLSGARRP